MSRAPPWVTPMGGAGRRWTTARNSRRTSCSPCQARSRGSPSASRRRHPPPRRKSASDASDPPLPPIGGAPAQAPGGSGPASSSSPAVSDDAEDPIPATGFTVWDAGVLLGAYVSQPEVWRRLTTASDVPPRKLEAKLDAIASTRWTLRGLWRGRVRTNLSVTRPCLSSGQARASPVWPSPALACRVRWRSPTCPACAPFCGTTRRATRRAPPPRDGFGKNRKIVGKSQKRIEPEPLVAAIPADVAVAVAPLRWGAETDVANLNAAFRNPRVVLGADLAYTENAAVVEKLAATVRACVPRGGVAVFASCRDHRPESVDLLEALLLEGARVRGEARARRRARAGVRAAGRTEPRDEDEPRDEGSQTAREFDESFRVVEFRRVAGDAMMSDAEAEAIRARDARGDAR